MEDYEEAKKRCDAREQERIIEIENRKEKHQQEEETLKEEIASAGLFGKKELKNKLFKMKTSHEQEMQKLQKQGVFTFEPLLEDAPAREEKTTNSNLYDAQSYAAALNAMDRGRYYGSNSSGKDASVIKRAAAGAVIAGPAGAVVGALSAVDKNNRKRR